ncbi:c-type cytochrome [Rubrimonas sp.]|uniref:c-type cytochrome n=1 Tax=Rubrimonas sp. TaxID=2036015 RepID=UPI002FDCF821
MARSRWSRGLAAAALAAAAVFVPQARAGGAPPQFKACKACHKVGEGAVHGIGPHLDGLMGRRAGGLPDFAYSSSMVAHGRDGLVWTPETLDAYLAKPDALVPGTRMSYRGMRDPADRAALIAWLADATSAEPAEDATVAPEVSPGMYQGALALAGDPAYGEYLASECVTCHQVSGRADGIPSIVGWPREAFVQAIFAYKTNIRAHEVMRMVTTTLGDEEIASLAAYFEGLAPQ